MEDEISRIEKDGYIGIVSYDEDPINPRENDNLGKMVCFHSQYELGDKTDLKSGQFDGWEGLKEYLVNEKFASVILPVYMLDHSGLMVSWDSGQIGYIYASKNSIADEFEISWDEFDKELLDKVEKILIEEVKEYNKYISGDVCAAEVYKKQTCNLGHEHLDFVDGCSDFYEVTDAEEFINETIDDLVK